MRREAIGKVVDLFGHSTEQLNHAWQDIIARQQCPYIGRRCYKVRKCDPAISIGTCAVLYGKPADPIIICPARLLERRQIFTDCLHLLTTHDPGNEYHVVSEIGIPGGNVDYFLVSVKDGRVRDFVGIELQPMDTTGSVWPERQRMLRELNVSPADDAETIGTPYGMNWKMTAKTISVQIHHKIETFEQVNNKLVLVVQSQPLAHMQREFNFNHLSQPASVGDPMHLHASQHGLGRDRFRIRLSKRSPHRTRSDPAPVASENFPSDFVCPL